MRALLLASVVGLLPVGAWAQDKVPASSEPEPSNGIGLIVTGATLLGVGAVDAAGGSLLCALESQAIYQTSTDQTVCWGIALGSAAVEVVVGLPLLIVGMNKHADHKEWEKRRGLAGLSIVPLRSGAGVRWALEF